MTLMTSVSIRTAIKPIHPFPARMAPEIVFAELRRNRRHRVVLDPMAGSGTTLVAARLGGHAAIGFDTDPLAVLIAKVGASDIRKGSLRKAAEKVLSLAKYDYTYVRDCHAYPVGADAETKDFVSFWFDPTTRRQLCALSNCIADSEVGEYQNALWCAFSRMIITKKVGVSRGIDVSHSRPHILYDQAPVRPFEMFMSQVEKLVSASSFTDVRPDAPRARVAAGDARSLPLEDGSVDLVITSPPYLNAIDYLRGHKLSLVWMGYPLSKLREIRGSNVGAEKSGSSDTPAPQIRAALGRLGGVVSLGTRWEGIARKYVTDLDAVVSELARVTKPDGKLALVIGDSTVRGVFVRNSSAIRTLCGAHGFRLTSLTRRSLPANKRYLPPPSTDRTTSDLDGRMTEEVILRFVRE